MKFIESVFQKLKRHPKRIVFPEGTEPRILQAAEQFVKLQLGPAIVLGKREEVEKVANPIMRKVYQSTGGAPGSAGADEDEDDEL